jgi:phosphatidylserine decarboxylase
MYIGLIVSLVFIYFIFIYKNSVIEKIEYIDRKTGEIRVEKVPGEGYLKWLYYNPFGKITAKTIVANKFLSEYYGTKMKSPSSKNKVNEFITNFGININESQKKDFESFNDFFIRKLTENARPIALESDSVASPADGKILAFENLKDTETFFIKGKEFDLRKFFLGNDIYKKYENGTLLIVRLCPADYHRYHFPVDGLAKKSVDIGGDFLSVSPYAVKQNIDIYFNNKRSYNEIETEKSGTVIMAEIGATMVGSIIPTFKENSNVSKGDEKGYFEFGGSTVILLFEKGKINIDEDIFLNTKKGYETSVLMGEKIGILKN